MKAMKKMLALALALALCFAMAIPAMAEGTTVLKMNDVTPNHTYKVYQVFIGDVVQAIDEKGDLVWQDEAKQKPQYVLSNVKYGSSHKEYGTGYVPASTLEGLQDTDANTLATTWLTDGTIALDKPWKLDWDGSEITDIPYGYYVIVDNGSSKTPADKGDANSAYMVEIVGPTTITPKTTVPQLDKKVKVENGAYSTTDTVSTEIGKTVQFQLEAKVPSADLLQYATSEKGTYEMTFKDTMSKGLTYDGNDTIKVYYAEEKDENLITDNYEAKNPVVTEDGTSIEVYISNLFNIINKDADSWTNYKDDKGNIVIIVTYTATLNQDAIVYDSASGAEAAPTSSNKAHLEYSNNPYDEGTGKTPDDETYVYSFKLDITKYENEATAGHELPGAGFTLYTATRDNEGKPIKGEALTFTLKDGQYVLDAESTVTEIFSSEEDGTLNFAGLEDKTEYYLEETTVPAGFNKCADRVIKITATHEDNGDGTASLTSLTITQEEVANTTGSGNEGMELDPESGTALDIVNKSGTLLPSTGGIGTTLFYAIGGVLVVGAGVLLFVRKRMGSKG